MWKICTLEFIFIDIVGEEPRMIIFTIFWVQKYFGLYHGKQNFLQLSAPFWCPQETISQPAMIIETLLWPHMNDEPNVVWDGLEKCFHILIEFPRFWKTFPPSNLELFKLTSLSVPCVGAVIAQDILCCVSVSCRSPTLLDQPRIIFAWLATIHDALTQDFSRPHDSHKMQHGKTHCCCNKCSL